MQTAVLIATVCLSVPPTIVGTSKGTETLAKALSERDDWPLKPDRFGFMPWQWVRPPGPGEHFSRIEKARAKFVSEKNGTVTIKTDTNQTIKIDIDKIGRLQRQWLDAERKKKSHPQP